ncbi:MAG: hypothetical protein LBT66_01915 [Methanobrevibacter sp.]|jgi:glutamine amidotransferase-like uncharacterized protein|nr:hypothetical protein [Candidatus Methanovirga meridionalis]
MKITNYILLFFLLVFIVPTIYGADINTHAEKKTIQIAIYNGAGSIENCVIRVESTIQTYNANHLETQINVKRVDHINTADDLSGVDVLLMPGGTHGYLYLDNTDGDIVREFVRSGHGYIGICAGAYAGAKEVDDNYNGYGVAPHINCIPVYHEGLTNINISSEGSNILGIPAGEYTVDHENGPAMYSNSYGATSLATYDGIDEVGHSGRMSIVLDTYGTGKTILFGPHPEADNPRYPDMLGNAIKYVRGSEISSSIHNPKIINSTYLNNGVNNSVNNSVKNSVPLHKTSFELSILLSAFLGIGSLIVYRIKK